jgi:ABC-2 type transport system ATP-binding protein
VSVESEYQISGLNELLGVHDVRVDGFHAYFSVEEWAINRVLEHLTRFEVHALTSALPTLEDLFLRHYELETEGAAR